MIILIKKKKQTYNVNFAAPPCAVALLVSRPTGVYAGVRLLLHWIDDEGAVSQHLLPEIVGQFPASPLPVDLLYGVPGHRTLQL